MFKIGFNRAAKILDELYDEGIVGPEEGTRPRKIVMSPEQLDRYFDEEFSGQRQSKYKELKKKEGSDNRLNHKKILVIYFSATGTTSKMAKGRLFRPKYVNNGSKFFRSSESAIRTKPLNGKKHLRMRCF